MKSKLIVVSQPMAVQEDLIETLVAISIVVKKLAMRVKLEKCQKEKSSNGKEKRIIIHC